MFKKWIKNQVESEMSEAMKDVIRAKLDIQKIKTDMELQLKHLEKWQNKLDDECGKFQDHYRKEIARLQEHHRQHGNQVETYLKRMNEILEKKL